MTSKLNENTFYNMSTKEELIHDINIVTLISSKQDMSLSSNAEKFLKYFEQKQSFKTGIGQQYLERLKQIADKSNPDTCFVCKRNKAYDGVLCENCMQKYTRGTKTFFKKPELDLFNELEDAFQEPPKTVTKTNETALNMTSVVKDSEFTNNTLTSQLSKSEVGANNISEIRKKYSLMSVLAVLFSIFLLFPVGMILALIDLSKKDGRKHVNDVAALIISGIWIVVIIGIASLIYDNDIANNTHNNHLVNAGPDSEKEYVSSDIDNSNQNSSADSEGNIATADFANYYITSSDFLNAYLSNYLTIEQFDPSKVDYVELEGSSSTTEVYQISIDGYNGGSILLGMEDGYVALSKLVLNCRDGDTDSIDYFYDLCGIMILTVDKTISMTEAKQLARSSTDQKYVIGDYEISSISSKTESGVIVNAFELVPRGTYERHASNINNNGTDQIKTSDNTKAEQDVDYSSSEVDPEVEELYQKYLGLAKKEYDDRMNQLSKIDPNSYEGMSKLSDMLQGVSFTKYADDFAEEAAPLEADGKKGVKDCCVSLLFECKKLQDSYLDTASSLANGH